MTGKIESCVFFCAFFTFFCVKIIISAFFGVLKECKGLYTIHYRIACFTNPADALEHVRSMARLRDPVGNGTEPNAIIRGTLTLKLTPMAAYVNGESLTISGGTVTTTNTGGMAVWVDNGGIVNIEGGIFSIDGADRGLNIAPGGSLTMNGGSIDINNTAAQLRKLSK